MPTRDTPVNVAKMLNLRPQQIYSLIKTRRVSTYRNGNGKPTPWVELEEVQKALDNPMRRKREEGDEGELGTTLDARASEGELFAYRTRFSIPRPTLMPTESDMLQYIKDTAPNCYLFKAERADGKQIPVNKDDFNKRLKRGEIELVRPESLIRLLIKALEMRKDEDSDAACGHLKDALDALEFVEEAS